MRKEKTLFIIGLWIIVLPFLGFPSIWKTILLILTGLSLFYLGYLFYVEANNRLTLDESKSFIDNVSESKRQI